MFIPPYLYLRYPTSAKEGTNISEFVNKSHRLEPHTFVDHRRGNGVLGRTDYGAIQEGT